MKLFVKLLLGLSGLFLSSRSFAYFTTGESGDLVPAGQYHIGIEPQMRISDGAGMNFTGFIDAPYKDDSSVRAAIGFGETDITAGLSYKWVPIPDYDKQPAIGIKTEAVFGRRNSINYNSLRFHPIVSKAYDTEIGPITPYISTPFSLNNSSAGSNTSLQLVLGSEYHHENYKKWFWNAELGMNVTNAFTYVSASMIYLLDDTEIRARKHKQ